jgi:hypothetical protein
MRHPVTPEDFAQVGSPYTSEALVTEIDRLLPLATADVALFAARGYGPAQLMQLQTCRVDLTTRTAEHRQQHGTKKSARTMRRDVAKSSPARRRLPCVTVRLAGIMASGNDVAGRGDEAPRLTATARGRRGLARGASTYEQVGLGTRLRTPRSDDVYPPRGAYLAPRAPPARSAQADR